ncbi:SPOR domain-containing protein [Marinimicrobium sp. ARAG 43.8]|uniref:SPOR domain-containing protein n=1 Tax=Marinimicrobium sp. ARAG 43.8 TaxID=3418719 RepID=UPI003CF6EA95
MQSATPDDRDAPLADYRQYYGLSDDPFRDDPDFPFFGGGGRRALLEQLQHLCQFSASLLAVLGKPEVGKSRVALELANGFGASDEICLLNAEPGAGAADILSHMARHFALPVEDNASVGRLLAALRHFAQVTDEEDCLALTIIDDAHHLDEQTLGALISLLQGQEASSRRLHIVLFAEPDMVTRLDQFNMHDVLIHDFDLPPFTVEEAADYLNFRMEMSDYMGPEVFNEAKVEPWWREAGGRLRTLHERARQALLESVTPDAPERESRGGSPLPLVHIVVVAVLLGVLLMVFLYSGSEDSDDEEVARLTEDRDTQTLTLPSRNSEEASGTSGEALPLAEQATDPADDRDTLSPSPLQSDAAEASAPDTVEDSSQNRTTPNRATPDRSSQEKAASSQPEPQGEVESQPEPEPEPEHASVPNIPEDEQVLLSWRASEYTLQLLGTGTRASVERYVSEQSNRQQLLIFESRRQGKPWFVVVTGRYSSTSQARAAISGLPAGQREGGPWPRAVGDIQDEIESQRGL